MSNIVSFEDNSKKVLNEMDSKCNKALTAIGLKAVSIWQKIITEKGVVDTGRFKNSTTHEVNNNDKSVTIGSNVEYATYLEVGTSRMKSRPTLKPTVLDYTDSYKKIVETILKE